MGMWTQWRCARLPLLAQLGIRLVMHYAQHARERFGEIEPIIAALKSLWRRGLWTIATEF